MMILVNSFRSEWLKTKRSTASWLTICGALLIPLLILLDSIGRAHDMYRASQSPRLWEMVFSRCWDVSNVMLLPLGVILVTSLVGQIEFRNNAWKQLMTTPQSLSTVFFSKLLVILVMLLSFFALLNFGIYLCGVLPSLFYRGVPYPVEAIPFAKFLKVNTKYFIDALPLVALQYLVSIRFRNFLVPLGVGIGLYVASMLAVSWTYGYFVPYTYPILNTMRQHSPIDPNINLHAWALGYFVIITGLSYLLFITKKEKG